MNRRYVPIVVAAAFVLAAGMGITPVAADAQVTSGAVAPGAAQPAWVGHGHVLSSGAENVVTRLSHARAGMAAPAATPQSCRAERSPSGNVQVNCLREDGSSPQNTQSETSVAAHGKTVVVGYNDSLVCCSSKIDFSGYSVSRDGGRTFFDHGVLPFSSTVQPEGDPALAVTSDGTFYYSSLAASGLSAHAHSLLSVYRMRPGESSFHLLSVPVDVGDQFKAFADKEYLAVGRDGTGHEHLYLTWTYFTTNVPSPIMLTDSTDGHHWRTTPVSTADACAQGSNPVPAGGTLYISWVQAANFTCVAGDPNPTGMEMMAAVNVRSATVLRRTIIAPIRGSGDAIVACNSTQDLREVIETAPGHDVRLFELPATTRDRHGILYAAWNDRPQGLGGLASNSTRIYLAYSRDGDRTWSAPVVISGAVSATTPNDRFEPWITADTSGLHAMWYHRVGSLLQTDKRDLTLAGASSGPTAGAETRISTVRFPIVQTNPNQDPVIAYCYGGDYNNITSANGTRYVTWGDNRNVVKTTNGVEHQPDVFLARY